ncbi:Der1-like family-domain-containing protein [Armillaria nabsnona]|nr:Der1-like family-domain-containing protein [Armillaria nabsnona]
MADSILTEIRKIPPVTRFLTTSLLGVTIPYLLGIISPYTLLYHRDSVLQKLQIWRLYTSFFIGSSGINFIFELAMLYQTSNQLEATFDSADLTWQLFFACIAINVASHPLGASIFLRPLMHCLTYISSARAPPGAQSSFFGLLTIPVVYVPYTMLAVEFLMGGPAAAGRAVVGTVVGHLWWWRVWSAGDAQGAAWARAPRWVKDLVGSRTVSGGSGSASGVHVYPPRTRGGASGSGTGSSSGISRGYNWGSGQRLGNN